MGPRTSCRSAGASLLIAASAFVAYATPPSTCYTNGEKSTQLEQASRPRPREAAYLCAVVAAANKERKLTAAAKLAVLRDHDVARSLVWSLNDAEPEVRAAVAEALGSCGNRGTVPWLILSLNDSGPSVSKAARTAIERLTGRRDAFDSDDGPQNRWEDCERWGKWFCHTDWDTIENDLVAHISTADSQAAREAIEALSHVGGERGRAALREFVERGAHPDESLRLAAIRALGDLRDSDAVPLLAQILDDALAAITTATRAHQKLDPSNVVLTNEAAAAIEALDRVGTREAEELLRAISNKFAGIAVNAAGNTGPRAPSAAKVLQDKLQAALRNIEAFRQSERRP